MDYRFTEDYLAKPDESLASHNAKLLENLYLLKDLGYLQEKDMPLLIEAAQTHDLGKIVAMFQYRVRNNTHFDPEKEVGHNILSAFLVDLEGKLERKDFYRVVHIVLNHHHYVNNYKQLDESKRLIVRGLAEITDAMAKYGIVYSAEALLDRLGTRALKRSREAGEEWETKILQGYLYKCDYAASAGIPIEYPNDFLSDAMDKLPFEWNELQVFCREHRSESLLISAPTGMGKTEAALWWLGNGKGFYVLPLKTAINAIYLRIRENILCEQQIEERLGLLHGDSIDIYLSESTEESEWDKAMTYYQRTRSLSLPLTVTTPDQLFDFVYKYEGYELKWTTLSYSKIIIDEIQAYSPDLLAYLIYGLQSVALAGGQFAVFTATLPPFISELLMDIPKKKGSSLDPKLQEDQKRLSKCLSKIKKRRFSSDLLRHHLSLVDKMLDAEDIREVYHREEKKKILVVCNTVKQAQELYESLKEEGEVYLLHAKFIQKHRKEKEVRILLDGRTFEKETKRLNDKKVIWIATQIVEASLDIDFDYVFTELTDLNGLFQRLGRCNRKGVKSIKEPNCFVYTQINEHLFFRGEKGFIDQTLYELSKEALIQHGNGILTEDEKFDLIEEYFTLENIQRRGSAFYEKYQEIYHWISELCVGQTEWAMVKKMFRNILSYSVIPEPVYEQYREEIDEIMKQLQVTEENLRKKGCSSSDRRQLRLLRTNLRKEVKSYCLNVGIYDIPPYMLRELNSSSSCVSDRNILSLGKEKIAIVPCVYTEEAGFQRLTEKQSQQQVADRWDAFM